MGQDDAIAHNWYVKAAKAGYLPAQYGLGLIYAGGRGVQQDYVKAYSWLFVAAASNEPNALRSLKAVKKKLEQEQLVEAAQAGERLSLKYGL